MNPAGEIKSALNVGNIIKFAAGTFVFFAIADLLGVTTYFLTPVTALRAKFGKASGS